MKYGWSFGEASPLKQVAKCRKPMLFIHGDNDTYVPTAMVYPLYEAKPQPKQLWIAPGSKHALSYRDRFHSILFGDPLLTTTEDSHRVIEAIAHEFPQLTDRQALVLMGHGTTHFSNAIYAALDYTFKDAGYPNIFLGTVEAYPSLDSILKLVKCYGPEEIILAPFMIVAGDHAKNDMAGDDPDSWYSRFTEEGYKVSTVLKGLGQYPEIRQIFIDHIGQVIGE